MKPEILCSLFQPITTLKGIGPKTAIWMKHLCGGNRIIDVLWHFPISVKARPVVSKPLLDEISTFPVTVMEYVIPTYRKAPLKIIMKSQMGEIQVIFFHYYLAALTKKFPVGTKLWISGILRQKNHHFVMIHPDFMSLDLSKVPSYEVIYPMTMGGSNTFLSQTIQSQLNYIPDLSEWIPDTLLLQYKWPRWKEAMTYAHQPQHPCHDIAKKRLIFDELLAHQIALKLIHKFHNQQRGIMCPNTNMPLLTLPFSLTGAQERVLSEIRSDLSSTHSMNRLLQGDVGSGKTIVAVLSALQVIAHGYQVAFMAPTDILSCQHYEKILHLFKHLKIEIALLTSKVKGVQRREILSRCATGQIKLLIGTHALIEENVQFQKLALAIVDEQHKFGVNQRLQLRQKQLGCHLLVMSATPIPRSLAMTLYGDMDVSILNEKPQGRQPITTRVISLKQIPKIIQKLHQTSAQVYWVCPLVSESEKSDLMAAEKRYMELRDEFPNVVGLIHGQMKPDEKDAVMNDFILGKIRILVSTTVIEVGVDVPNASIMIIEHAERFGLASLHQLRGRVGRGNQQSSCILLYGHISELGKKRLDILRQSNDGFEIAQADLTMRGAGEVLGVRQSGFDCFRLAHLPDNQDLLDLANHCALDILSKDPDLNKNPNLRILLYLFEREKAILTLKAG